MEKKIQNKQEDIEALQQDLLTCWSEKWLLSFNTDKCKVMNLGAVDNGRYFLHDNNKQAELLCCENEKDLGVWISNDLKWSKQCSNAANKAMSVLGMIKRSFTYISIESFKILYNTFRRCTLQLLYLTYHGCKRQIAAKLVVQWSLQLLYLRDVNYSFH